MISTNWTLSRSLTFWELIFCVFWNIISIALLFMAWLTKMGVPPTKPLGNRTAKFAFKLNKIVSMLWTIVNRNITTSWTYKFFRIIFLWISCIHHISTIFPTSKIGLLAFITHKVGINCHCIIFWLIKVRRFFIGQSFILVALLKFKTIQGHFFYFIMKFFHFFQCIVQFIFRWNLDPYFTKGTKTKAK